MALAAYLDTSALLKLYVLEAESGALVARLRKSGAKIIITPLHELELTSALTQRVFRKESSLGERDAILDEFKGDLTSGGFLAPEIPWPAAFRKAAWLVRGHAAGTGTRSIDALHVAAALASRCELFITFDDRQRALARSAKLKLWPARRP